MTIGEEGDLRVVQLWSGDTESWQLMPSMLYRIGEFAKKYDSDADIYMMVASLKQAFVNPQPQAFMLGLILDGKLVGHLLVSMEYWFGTKFATIVQYEVNGDRPIPRKLAKRAMDWVETWAVNNGAAFLQALARNQRVARAFSVFHGFEETRVVMRKPLSTDVAKAGNSA